MHYTISYGNPLSRYLEIVLKVKTRKSPRIRLQLPAWRPGRYELSNYAKNLRNIVARDLNDNSLKCQKIDGNTWQVNTRGAAEINVHYQYFAFQPDAGGSLLDDQQLYLNFINCLLYVKNKLREPCTVHLKLRNNFKIACGLKKRSSRQLRAKDYYQLVDSPLIASPRLKQWKYQQNGIRFHLWFMGSHRLNKSKVLKAFKAFSKQQIDTMGSFPEKDYHFLFQISPLRTYHGVEHSNSTVIALGPGSELHGSRYNDFLGVSSHELFHCWNVLKIRPKELLPYDFSKETYFDTGFVAEGITTYYGDLFLVRSGVFSQEQYFKELDTLLKRHFENEGRHHASLVDSSRDLWVDGYQQGAPARKVSIYTKGALVSLLLDLKIRKFTANRASLDEVMRKLWKGFGKKNRGYSLKDFQKVCEQVIGQSLKSYFKDFIYGTKPIEDDLSPLLDFVGCRLKPVPSRQLTKKLFGFRTIKRDPDITIHQIASGSPASEKLSIGDTIISINGKKPRKNLNLLINVKSPAKLVVNRQGRDIRVTLKPVEKQFFEQFRIVKLKKATKEQQQAFCKWLGI